MKTKTYESSNPTADHVTNDPIEVYLSGLKASSRRVMRQALDVITDLLTERQATSHLDWASVCREDVLAVRNELLKKYRPATVNRKLSALKGVLRSAWQLGLVDQLAYRSAVDFEAVIQDSPPSLDLIKKTSVLSIPFL